MNEERCRQCNGVGEIMETAYGDVQCPHCGGTGIELESSANGFRSPRNGGTIEDRPADEQEPEPSEPFREPDEDLYREVLVKQPQEGKPLVGRTEGQKAAHWFERARVIASERDLSAAEALDLLERHVLYVMGPETVGTESGDTRAAMRAFLRKYGRLTEGGSQ